MEVRHRSWQERAVREFLAGAGLEFCNIDQPMVSYPMGATRWVTGSRGYLRCHGRRQEAWFEFGEDRGARYDYLYTPEELEDLAARTRELMEKAAGDLRHLQQPPRGPGRGQRPGAGPFAQAGAPLCRASGPAGGVSPVRGGDAGQP